MDTDNFDAGATAMLAARAGAFRYDDLPDDIVELSVQCLLDFLAVTLAGSAAAPVRVLAAAAAEESPNGAARIIGSSMTSSPFWAAWINGTAAHVHVYDDVNMAIPGHGSAVTLPAILALAQAEGGDGRRVVEAFVAGYETTCALGAAMAPSHYEMGYHASSTIGSFGAAAASSRFFGLDVEQIGHAFGAASTMSGGLKAVFGTMAKSVQVGRAAATGITAARLARKGLTTGGQILEHRQGFISVYSKVRPDEIADRFSQNEFFLRGNLFKYFAACYMAHAAIECAIALRPRIAENPFEMIHRVELRVHPAVANVCNIERPTTPLEAKYSLRAVVAMALTDISPAKLENFDKICIDYGLVAPLAARTSVVFDDELSDTECVMRLGLVDGSVLEHHHDAGRPAIDLAEQRTRLEDKFMLFVEPILGHVRTLELKRMAFDLPQLKSVGPLIELTRP